MVRFPEAINIPLLFSDFFSMAQPFVQIAFYLASAAVIVAAIRRMKS